ncbi:hypothetical protein [Actinomadura sp. KC216]|uniref:hypothetical protein n=1 Tax=Actinomadura sp. KC216 TaxID=2530370 RepID=UPI001FB713B7|nr:hypothetical protein [Actinomadura sp. KC216]
MEKASLRYHEQLTPAAVEYLTGPDRGLTEETIERFRLGVVDDPLPGHEGYRGRIVIPYLTNYGVTTLRFRKLGGDEKYKYLSLPGDPSRIFNPAELEKGHRSICVSEGEFDCMVAMQCDLPCIGIPGVDHWDPILAILLSPYEHVFLLQDAGDAGQQMADRMAKELRHNLRPIVMGDDDTTSFFLQHGRDGLRNKVIGNG